MKKLLFSCLLAVLCMGGFAQGIIDPLLTEEMGRRGDDEKIDVVVIMKSRYDRMQLNRRADYFPTRAARREFVVNELKAFAEASQYDLRHSLAELQRNGLTTEPSILWMANALYFSATKSAVESLSKRADVEMIGYAIERNWIPDGEVAMPASATREITQNVIKVGDDQVWALGYTGEGVVVAVIDTGVNYNHLDVADHLWDGGSEFPHHGYDVKNNDNDPMDDHGHGSHCAGTVCGDGTAGSQTGMAPNATLMCVKCLDSSGNGGVTSISAGIQWAVEHGCDMFSMSLGIANSTVSERTLLRHTCDAALDAGIVGAIAAGNEGDKLWQYPIPNNVRVPGSCPPPYMDEVQGANPGALSCSVCVGAVDYNDNAANFTSNGPVTWTNTEFGDYEYDPGIGLIRPDVCAPGVSIKSLNYATNSGYTNMSGTSMATPCVAGCMALMLSKDINLSPEDICRILEETALPLSPSKSNIYGFGRVNVLDAIELVTIGDIKFKAFEINDVEGNNNHKLNPGETVSMSLTLDNITDHPVSGVSVALTTENAHVTLIDNQVDFPDFAANQTLSVENAFTLSVDDAVAAKQQIRFRIEVNVDGEITGRFLFNVDVYDYLLQFGAIEVLNDDNANGILEPGENADLRIFIDNVGNEMAQTVDGVLSSDYQYLTISQAEMEFGTVGAELMAYADFNVTLDAAAPANAILPFALQLTDIHGKQTDLEFQYKKSCTVIFSLVDYYYDGWNGAYIYVEYSDGTPAEQMTIDNGSYATYTRELASNSTVTLTWHSGNYDNECSFEIKYDDGTIIYQNTGGMNAPYSFVVNCSGGSEIPNLCSPIQNLEYELVGRDVVLTWDAPRGVTPTGYEVYRETQLLATVVDALMYTDPDMEDGLYNYCVYAVYDDCQSEYVCIEVEVVSCSPILNLDYSLNDDLLLTLTWDEPAITTGLIEYQVYMDGELMGATNELTYAFTIAEGTHDINVKAVFETCEAASIVAVCVVGAVENLDYLNMEGHHVQVVWNPIEGISAYEVSINGEWVATVEEYFYAAEFEAGSTVVTVKPVAEGCYVLSSSIEVCVIDPIENITFSDLDGEQMMRCSWDPVDYAEFYSVIVNGDAVAEQLTEPHYTFAPQVGVNEVCVIATSIYGCHTWPYECASQTVYAAVGGFDYSFDGNNASLSWNGDAPSYSVQLDNMDEEIVEGNTLLKEVANGDHLLTVIPIYPDAPAFPAQFMFTVTNLVPEIRIIEVYEGMMATKWNAVEGAKAYNLYRDGELIAENLTETAFNDTEMPINAVHCYAVQTVFEKGISDLSEAACANYFHGLVESEGKVKLYPNPTTDKVTVEGDGMTRVEVYSIEGKLVRCIETDRDTCQIEGLENGIYTLRIFMGDEILVRRIVKM